MAMNMFPTPEGLNLNSCGCNPQKDDDKAANPEGVQHQMNKGRNDEECDATGDDPC